MGIDSLDEGVRADLFRLVEALPHLESNEEVARHLREGVPDGAPWPMLVGRWAARVPALAPAVAWATRAGARLAARRFLVPDPAAGVAVARAFATRGIGTTFDLLGEAVLTEGEADRDRDRLLAVVDALAAAPPLARNLSIKCSALSARFDPCDAAGSARRVLERLAPVAARARAAGTDLHLDMEEYETREIVFAILRNATFPAGVVLQSYLRDAESFCERILEFGAARGAEIPIRLVRGAYWETEVARALAAGRTPPVWRRREETDACYHRLLDRLLEEARAGRVRLSIATHNAASIDRALARLAARGIPPRGEPSRPSVEFQMLYGMGEAHEARIRAAGAPLRYYLPVGDLLAGIGYLVRRLLENASNESLLGRRMSRVSSATPVEWPRTALVHAPLAAWEEEATLGTARLALDRSLASTAPIDVPAVVDGRPRPTNGWIPREDPADPDRILSRGADASPADADAALAAARRAQPAWEAVPPARRAEILDRAAGLLLSWRWASAARVVCEAGKPLREADGDLCEAVDHLRHAARALREPETLLEPEIPGERNSLHRRPRGVVAAITPWNFPLAIPAGVLGPALAAGNAVVWKPAEETPGVSRLLFDALLEAGVPPGALALLPGRGEVVGAALAAHPETDLVAFTGSREAGLAVIASASAVPARRGPRKVIAEMGGKNAILVDPSCDPDEAVRGILASAFDYAGQKCSACARVILLPGAERLLSRLAEAAASLAVGPARDPATQIPPLITAAARARVLRYAEVARRTGRVHFEGRIPGSPGHYVPPIVVEGLPDDSPILSEEIFGPILAAVRARDLAEGLARIHAVEFALTAGIYSRAPSRIREFLARVRAGNVYVNRRITGAVVARHPFGGFGFSGTGEKAGGPNPLDPYSLPVAVSERTVRHGWVPLE